MTKRESKEPDVKDAAQGGEILGLQKERRREKTKKPDWWGKLGFEYVCDKQRKLRIHGKVKGREEPTTYQGSRRKEKRETWVGGEKSPSTEKKVTKKWGGPTVGVG